eukprot:TRINITY_DN79845_c0_g1_i1.p1 TRINITY_DN79845_c0_g1~~TRINITY_DN79845_c0_g1_i1.p1  ORF type:complete len:502 (+),score=120.12 TRINITY_DN79845_c0_g1_i1:37-1542(+)
MVAMASLFQAKDDIGIAILGFLHPLEVLRGQCMSKKSCFYEVDSSCSAFTAPTTAESRSCSLPRRPNVLQPSFAKISSNGPCSLCSCGLQAMIERMRKFGMASAKDSDPKEDTARCASSAAQPGVDRASALEPGHVAEEAAAAAAQAVAHKSRSRPQEEVEGEEAPVTAEKAVPASSGTRADVPNDGGEWKLEEDDSDNDVRQVRPSATGSAEGPSASAGGTPRSGTSTVASYPWNKEEPPPPLLIPGDASLLDGLRAVLVHHLKKSAGTQTVNLTSGQAELLEHHLSRLASYAQKIVHTLAFATRFLSSQQNCFEGDRGDLESPHGGASTNASDRGAEGAAAAIAASEANPQPTLRKIKLKDREILDIYRSAQQEASKEADWRGIPGPSPSRSARSDPCSSARSETSQLATVFASQGPTAQGEDVELLRVISRAMQQPGRTPQAFAAEIAESSNSTFPFCRSAKGLAAQREAAKTSSAMVQWPQVPPDPGSRRRAGQSAT